MWESPFFATWWLPSFSLSSRSVSIVRRKVHVIPYDNLCPLGRVSLTTRAIKFSCTLTCWRKFYALFLKQQTPSVRELDCPANNSNDTNIIWLYVPRFPSTCVRCFVYFVLDPVSVHGPKTKHKTSHTSGWEPRYLPTCQLFNLTCRREKTEQLLFLMSTIHWLNI